MNKPSDHSSRRIIPVQFWELLHTFKHFFSEIKNLKKHFFFFFCNFSHFSELLTTFFLNLTMKKGQTKQNKNTQV